MEILYREVNTHTVETILLLGCIGLITFVKITHEIKFQRFLGAYVSDKYLKLYGKEQDPSINKFNTLLFVVQLIVFGMLLEYSLEYLDIVPDNINLLLVIVGLGLFVMFKFYLEKIVATIFDLSFFLDQYNFHKLTYRNLTAIVLLPLMALLIYNPMEKKIVLFITISIFLLLNFIAWGRILKKHQKFLFKKLFYFILYLCALEIAPYLIIARVAFFS
ncbi:DUF4271 domain-containing protein [Sinomicrobium weinanense]|uniref:DUF4271 domain-containing protein n=1 Tax=Sinomicrobium weinanense TaxID=2842200 RepID=A0A926JUE7_9FLAO|nr:DUF4271 domain-containing protein [Sinomicrobium weinanense]MBC9797433.1 DUF4271 domain-containing protein [Sinomicrobium weinanense]MBU3125451.1 DUF4271 domain-containing protein [Sinomicrobium weinanense]